VTSLEFALGIAVGLGVSAAVFLLVWVLLHLQRRRLATPPAAGPSGGEPIPNGVSRDLPGAPHPEPGSVPPPPNVERFPATPNSPPEAADPNGLSTAPVDPPESSEPGSSLASEDDPEPAVQVSHRVLLHLYRQGRLSGDEVAPRARSQAGMIESLRVRQGTLAGVLQRLEAAGVVSAETAHVRGGPRRVKVYRLTDRGLQLARELQAARSPRKAARSRR